MQQFQRIVKSSLTRLKLWSKDEFEGRKRQQEKTIQRLHNAKQGRSNQVDGEEIRRLESQMNVLLMDEEIYLKQRSRADWLKEGDKNTKFFHAKASARKRKNKIWGIENSHGSWLKEKEKIESEFYNYFQELFTSTNPTPN